MPEMLGFMPRRSLAQPPNKWRTDNGRQAMGHDTGYNNNVVDESILGVGDKCRLMSASSVVGIDELVTLKPPV